MSFKFVVQALADRAVQTTGKVKGVLTLAPERPKVFNTGTPVDDLRRGSLVGFDGLQADFILAKGDGSFVTQPKGYLTVKAAGRIEDGNLIRHRFYLAESGTNVLRMLQVVTDWSGENLVDGETKLFQQLVDPITPFTKKVWDRWTEWTVENPGTDAARNVPPKIGGLSYFHKVKGYQVEYRRLLAIDEEGSGPDAINFDSLDETLYTSDYGDSDTLTHMGGEYWRPIGDSYEFLMLDVLRHGMGSSGERWIELSVGLSIDPTQLEVVAGK